MRATISPLAHRGGRDRNAPDHSSKDAVSMISRFALAASLALALAACGSDNQASDQPAEAAPGEAATAAPEAVPTADASASPADGATPTPTPSATPSAQPSGTPSPQASAAAPAGPPQAFNQCTACHSTTPGKTIIGPSLAGIYGDKAGAVPGFQFSDAMKNSGITWNAANLDAFLANPMAKVPGTIMGFAGIKDDAQRKAVVDYLKTL
jgi:cytochrome c2